MVPEKIIRLTLFRSHSFVSYKLHIPSFNLMLDTTRQAFTYPVDFVHLSNSFRSLDLLSGMFPMSRSECKFENEERPLGRRKGARHTEGQDWGGYSSTSCKVTDEEVREESCFSQLKNPGQVGSVQMSRLVCLSVTLL